MAKYYISTPIYYVNDKAHIGHAYTTIAADVMARYQRQQGREVLLSTGTDENSQKVVGAAEIKGQSPKEFADILAEEWSRLWQELRIGHDVFIRTTDEVHRRAVYALFDKIRAGDDIYKGVYRGLYCVGCEDFIKEADLVNGKCPEHDRAPETLEENNYFFRLSKYQQQLLDHIEQNPEFVQPETRRHEVVAFIRRGLDDISITREKQQWGIPYPFDEKHVIYVWTEALINYLTATGYPDEVYEQWWPADCHLVGKGIIKFHCIIWPAMLMSAGLPLPKTVFAHGHLNLSGKKISKSIGNVIDPKDLVGRYGVDASRYLLLRDTPFGQDGDITEERFQAVYNSELADDLGNLVSRVAAMIVKYQDGVIGPKPSPAHDIARYHEAMSSFRFDRALSELSVFTKDLNLYIEEEKPWQVAKSDPEHLQEILAYLAANIEHLARFLFPFMPDAAQLVADTFHGDRLSPLPGPLFPKSDPVTTTDET